MTRDELETILFANMSPRFFQRLLRAVFAAHKVAAEECAANFKVTEADNIIGQYRRAKLEGFMRDAADMEGIVHRVERSRLGSWNHTELESGPVVLTASTVQEPCDIVEDAEFRNTLARGNQGVLWSEPDDEPAEDSKLYVLLLHSKNRVTENKPRHAYLPGSAYVAFPLPDLSGYAHEINLFEKFPHIVEAHLPQEWDTEAKVRYMSYARKMRAS